MGVLRLRLRARKHAHGVTARRRAHQRPLVRHEPLDAHGTPSVDPARCDAHLSAQPEAIPVGESGGGVVEDAGAVDALDEELGSGGILGDDGLRVTTVRYI